MFMEKNTTDFEKWRTDNFKECGLYYFKDKSGYVWYKTQLPQIYRLVNKAINDL